jgi:hypothetical protein
MKRAHYQAVASRRIEQLLRQTATVHDVGARVEFLSGRFLGHPYVAHPLVGSAETPEVLVASIDGFDCVTYVETILALAQSSARSEYKKWLRRIRYEGGQMEWRRRNHYMTSWIRNNSRLGIVRALRSGVTSIVVSRTLDAVPGLRPLPMRFRCTPKRFLTRLTRRMKSGDLIFFASTRRHLDVFHCGIIVRQADRLLMRHASRSRKAVVDQELSDFVKSNRMSGIIVVRPA